MSVRSQTLSNALMDGTTRCPHCETRFKISDAQLNAHHGMVRCGHCMQAFNASPGSDQPHPQLLSEEVASHADEADERVEPVHDHELPESIAHEDAAPPENITEEDVVLPEHQTEAVNTIDEVTEALVDTRLPFQSENVDTLDFSQVAEIHSVAEPSERAGVLVAEQAHREEVVSAAELAVHEDVEAELPVHPKRRSWPWVAGLFVAALLLAAQLAYSFRVSLAAHLPTLKPALVQLCSLASCSVPLPQNSALISIESSGLEAESDHENQIAFSALLRNRASYTMAFPMLVLTLNDSQDKPLARRFFMPADYLQVDESAQAGFLENHEVSIKLHLNTADLRPAGYRMELFYSRD